MGQQRGKAVGVRQSKGIGEHPPKFLGKAENELQSVIAEYTFLPQMLLYIQKSGF